MDKIMFIMMKVMIVMVLATLHSTTLMSTESATPSTYTEVSKNDLKERIETLASEVDLRYTDEIHTIINSYIKRYRRGSQRIIGLSEQYFPLYEAEFNKQGLPTELKYLSIVESGLRPSVRSVSGAVGLWQFMKPTGQLYGLRINSTVDERKDPIKSTQAASQYLKDLHQQFGDWTLALAAYNCGPGNVRKALRRSQENEFWNLRGYLPSETRKYIPKYIAISYVMSYAHEHDLWPEYTNPQQTLATVKVYDYTSFNDISRITGLDKSTIYEYNPSFLKWYIPRSTEGYYLTLPQEDLYKYLAAVGGFENLLDLGYDSATLKGRYMLYSAMKRKAIAITPSISSLDQAGIVSLKKTNAKFEFAPSNPIGYTNHNNRRVHFLAPQEGLIQVSEKYNIPFQKLMELNDLNLNNPPSPGAAIRLE